MISLRFARCGGACVKLLVGWEVSNEGDSMSYLDPCQGCAGDIVLADSLPCHKHPQVRRASRALVPISCPLQHTRLA